MQAPRLAAIKLAMSCWGTPEQSIVLVTALATGRPRPLGWVLPPLLCHRCLHMSSAHCMVYARVTRCMACSLQRLRVCSHERRPSQRDGDGRPAGRLVINLEERAGEPWFYRDEEQGILEEALGKVGRAWVDVKVEVVPAVGAEEAGDEEGGAPGAEEGEGEGGEEGGGGGEEAGGWGEEGGGGAGGAGGEGGAG
jgi:hypothetical protein